MRTWRELSESFEALEPSLREARLDLQWGTSGDSSYLAGMVDPAARERFFLLAEIAGERLASVVLDDMPEEVLAASNPLTRWMAALRTLSSDYVPSDFLHMTDGDKVVGWIATGRIRRPAQASANLCLRLERAAQFRQTGLERALDTPALIGAAAHWQKSDGFLRTDPPDWPNAAKEAVSALEAVAKHAAARPGASLGDCIKPLRTRSQIHQALLASIEKLWGFLNESPGVRHGSPLTPSITRAELQYVRSMCEAGMLLLLSIVPAAERGVEADETGQTSSPA